MWKYILAGLGLMLIYNKTNHTAPRGIRNNNPLNLVKTPIPWKGKVPHNQNTDTRFEQFVSAEWGIRAGWRDVTGDIERKGLYNLKMLLTQFAPPTENNTKAYIESVSNQLGISPLEPIPREKYPELIAAIIKHENGINPYSLEFIEHSSRLG